MRTLADIVDAGVLFLFLVCVYPTEQGNVDTVLNILENMYGFKGDNANVPKFDSFSVDLQPQVQTTSGVIYGSKNQYANSFFSIPFAVSPVGDLRFRPPQKLDTPEIARNLSTKIGNVCVQPGATSNEDCLVLSVHVPVNVDLSDSTSPPSDSLPVLLFIHGGAYFIGAGTYSTYDGRFLSEATSTVVVTVNYRLGPLGFLLFDDGENIIDGNQGLRDQQLAMQWVKENIRNFGGDENKVTIFGESAGAQSVMFHLLSKTSEPSYRHAIMESNPAAYWYPDRTHALGRTNQLVQSLRCGALNRDDCCGPVKSNYTCLMEASPEALISGMLRIMGSDTTQLNMMNTVEPFRPYIDGDEFTDQPLTLFKEGKWNTNKPFIIGWNAEELVIFKYFLPMNEMVFREMNRRLFENQGNDNRTGDLISEKYVELYGSSISDYSYIFGIEMTDLIFGCTSRALARFASATTASDVYYYIFDHALDGPDCEERLGDFCGHSYHGAELNFVFRTIEHVGMIPDDEDILVSNQFSTYWGNMAWTGNPSDGPVFGLEGTFPEWQRYAKVPNEDIWTNLRFADPNAYVETNYLKDVCDFWDTVGVYEAPALDADIKTTTATTRLLTTSSGITLHKSIIPLIVSLFLLHRTIL